MKNNDSLRKSIIKFALEGKLSSFSNKTADEFFNTLIKEGGRIKHHSEIVFEGDKYFEVNGNLKTDITDEIPFVIPCNWKWCRFEDICNFSIGKTPERKITSYWDSGDVYWVSIADMIDNSHINKTKELISNKAKKECFSYEPFKPGSMLMSFKLTIGKTSIVDMPCYCNEAIMNFEPFIFNETFRKFLFTFIGFLSHEIRVTDAIKGSTLNKKKIAKMLIPVPPICEQKEIISKLEKLFPLIDEYEKLEREREDLDLKLPNSLYTSVLKDAFEGKLVTHDINEETGGKLYMKIISSYDKKRLAKIKEINCEDYPLEVPSNWILVRLGSVFNHSAGKALNSSDKEGKEYEYITTSNVYWNRFDLTNKKKMFYKDSELEKCTAKNGDLLVLEGGDIGRAAVWNYDFDIRIQNHIHCIRNVNNLEIKFYYYLFYLYKAIGFINGKGIAIQGLSANVLDNLIIPLPPIEEQKMIVAKIDSLKESIKEISTLN